MKHYNYIFAGSGLASLMTAYRMAVSGAFEDKSILLIDTDTKKTNDRTWCFWEDEDGFFESLVYKDWNELWINNEEKKKLINIAPYRYKMIRGIDFYRYCIGRIRNSPNITIRYGNITDINSDAISSWVQLDNETFTGMFVFSSMPGKQVRQRSADYHLLQHFSGWVIKTNEPVFDPARATLMDFRVPQGDGTAFVYIMPFDNNRALVEYTLFSEKLLDQPSYDTGLRTYIETQWPRVGYEVAEKEFGIIPMTNRFFPTKRYHLFYMGTAGGQTKPSSGYTFQSIQRHTGNLVQDLIQYGKPIDRAVRRKFHYYDSVLLNVLATGKMPGARVFSTMFERNKIRDIFRFLDNNSSLAEDLRVIRSLPLKPFLLAGLSEINTLF